ncbi:hypothetical protein A3H10_05065 [Candidatus Uhrbacteria bacterium RIFCSPLOWO2_12_FULL_46_10]|uniref:M23ase beta-sheet core domain-containing protein n=1 Tax=Candidatus Uhrbacteria bacterium RIFCSPLOWO2_01_FULL_47_25 TaxID=1802402 RepID=A0A1F7UXM6_9BACT|nr:MAG: Peptidase M23 [Parcubacteria group bacterium GW2011_GWA2_46_9]OGL60701.1 MAG: hypothetical protein A2752_04405 [Candidatus Uhrbacteria bacterium RIFCSPHIGHO2_01_FULL_46_23]OGL70332.1 MAG: hypothetical protein A3D60_01920 [Candidatus Uhrbacteria bacterium RIFCSPHIGHO2_02_FULL_47_29]OGL83019.1 MAG: hypothetical protein A2936_03665 [Candidatus Uhrbacteria bacterium RIFCSPLOWO2_01_FULL_47_25]OGL84465.1 MAG: hypothetical protein A3I37_03655 [Candidatus Uhrbacteria bacterium RIFCSPLOWO2_02_FU
MRIFKQRYSTTFIMTFSALIIILPTIVLAEEVNDLQATLREKLQRVEDLKKKAAIYEINLQQKRQERLTLSNQLTILTDRLNKTALDIEMGRTNVEVTNLEISGLENSIRAKEKQISEYKEQLGALVRWLAREQSRSIIQILFTRSSFADFYGELKQIKTVQISIGRLVSDVEALKNRLNDDKKQLEDKRQGLVEELSILEEQQLSFEAQQESKAYLLQETRSSEQRFSALLEEARREQEQTNQEITNLEREVRERLRQEGLTTDGEKPVLIWPVPRNRGLSTLFHDPDYPFRRLFEHSGIDIRAYQGTPIRTAASGYVARVQTGGKRGYGFVMIIHNGGLATVYGHVSKIMVKQDSFVAQGEVIALSGGIPGTPGAGPFSTGPHLHFETRLSGIPQDPLPFLP